MFGIHYHKNSNLKIRCHTLVSEGDGEQGQVIRVSTMLPSAGDGVLQIKLNSFWRNYFAHVCRHKSAQTNVGPGNLYMKPLVLSFSGAECAHNT